MEESLRLLKPYLRGIPLIILAMITGYLIMTQYLNYVTPKYESVTRLRLADSGDGVPNSSLYKDFDVFVSKNKIATEVEVLKSELLINRALDLLDFDIEIHRVGTMRSAELYNNSPFLLDIVSLESQLQDKVFNLYLRENKSYTLVHPDGIEYEAELGDTLAVAGGKLLISLNEPYLQSRNGTQVVDHYQFKKLSRNRLVSQVKSALSVLPVDKDVAVIRLVFESPHPEKASIFPDKLAEAYIEDYITYKSEAARMTVVFLNKQIEEVTQKLSRIELDIESYRNQEKITNIGQETETRLREISQMKIQQTNLLMNFEAIKELNEYIKTGADNFDELAPNFEAFTDLLSTELIKKMKELRSEKKDLLLIYTPDEDRVKIIDDNLNDIYNYLIESISNTRRNLEIKYENLSRDILLAELQLVDYPEKDRLLTILKREFEIYQESYNFLNEKKIEAEIAQAASTSFHRIIEQAGIPESPFSPNYIILKIVASLLSGGGVIVLIFLIHTIKARVNDKLTIEINSAIPIVATTPNLKKEEDLQKHFLHLVNQLEIKNLIRPNSILTVNTFGSGDGGEFHAIHASEALSRQNRRVLLVDVGNKNGWCENTTLTPLESGDIYSLTEKLFVVQLDEKKYSFYTNEQIADLLRKLSKGFDCIIVSNDLIGSQLSLQIMKAADTNVVVADSRLTPAKVIPRIDLIKEEFSIDEIYFILNRSGYNPNIVIEVTNWVLNKAGLRDDKFKSLTYA